MDFREFLEKYKCDFFGNDNPVFDFEVEIFHHIHHKNVSLITKSRQMGLSTLYIMYMFWFIKYDYSHNKDVIYVTDNLRHTIQHFQKIKMLIYQEEMSYRIPNFDMGFVKKNTITYNGKSIIIKDGREYLRHQNFRGKRFEDVELIIFDEISFLKVFEDGNGYRNGYWFHEYIFRNIPKISIGFTPQYGYDLVSTTYYNHSTLYLNQIALCVYNYNLHYGKSPLWTYERLNNYLNGANKNQWDLAMECKYDNRIIVDSSKNDEPIILKPYKSQWDLAIEKELNLLLNEDIHE
jgi:hypothetical protein